MFKKITLIAAFLIFANTVSYACSCAGLPTVSRLYDASEFVGIVKFVSAKEGEIKDGRPEILGLNAVVQKVYKGPLKPGERLYFANRVVTSCDYNLSKKMIGKEMLLYKKIPEDGVNSDWQLSVCGGQQFVERAADDLLYIDNIEKVKGRSRISGMLTYEEKEVIEERPAVYRGLAGYKVKITGNGKTYEVTTDENGVYEIYDLPEGVYKIEIPENPLFVFGWSRDFVDYGTYYREYEKIIQSLPKKLQDEIELNSNGPSKTIFLPSGKHASVSFDYRPRSSISGTITGPDAKPIKDIKLNLISAEGTPSSYFFSFSMTSKHGRYDMDEVPPGKYYLVANPYGKVSPDEPYDMTFYPGTTDKTKAVQIQIGLGDDLKDVNVRISKIYETVVVSGRFLFADGKPVDYGSLEFVADNEAKRDERDKVYERISDGTFKMRLLKGLTGKIMPSLFIVPKDYTQCPEVKSNEPAPRPDRYPQYILAPIPVTANKNISGLVIKLPFKSCKKVK